MKIRLASLTCVLLFGGFLTGCGGADQSSAVGTASDAGAAGSESAVNGAVRPAEPAGPPVEDSPVGSSQAAGSQVATTRLVRTAEITLEAKDVSAAARSVRTVAVTFGGLVSSESTTLPAGEPDPDDPAPSSERSVITLRVPEPKLDDALTKIATIGRAVDRTTSSEDVTATIVDLDSRVATQVKSVARVRELLEEAESLPDVVMLESELARRESDLESIQARQRALVDKATLATITVTVHTSGAIDRSEATGFWAGLGGGWTALKASTTMVLTVLGALLPVGVVVAVLAVAVNALRRKRPWRTASTESASATPVPEPTVAP